jgi:hypothetical protein
MLSKTSPATKQFHDLKGVMDHLATPLTAGSFVRIICYLRRMPVEYFSYPKSNEQS